MIKKQKQAKKLEKEDVNSISQAALLFTYTTVN